MKTTWSAQKVRAAVSATTLAVATHARVLSATTQAAVLSAQAVVGHFIKFIRAADEVRVTELVRLLTGKVFDETTGTADESVLSIGKGLFDTARFADTQTKNISKILDDSDYVEAGYFASDYVSHGFDIITMSDAVVLKPGKGISDTARFSDTLTRRIGKSLYDTVGVTDDVDGLTSIEDDETMQFTKVLTDQAVTSDSFARLVNYRRTFGDVAASSDLATKNCGKPLADPTFVTDTQAIRTAKVFTDAMSVTETSVLKTTKVFSDSTGMTDSGSLRSQGYSDFTYFAEDYVGDSRTF